MLRDFRDKNKDLITMFKGTDKTHKFIAKGFNWDDHTVFCEGRLAAPNEVADLLFDVTHYTDADFVEIGLILFPKEKITTSLRENRLYWKVLATHKVTQATTVINYGVVLLKEV